MPLTDFDDAKWAEARLEAFADSLRTLAFAATSVSGVDETTWYEEAREQALRSEIVSRKILTTLDVDLPDKIDLTSKRSCNQWEEAAFRGLGLLQDIAELDSRINDRGPKLSARSLHQVVWVASERLLTDGHATAAVQTAATAVSTHIAGLTGVELTETALVRQVFSADTPKNGGARLRWVKSGATPRTVQSINDGIRNFAQGCFLAMRNPASHGAVDLTEQQAVEQLAALSTLMRWVDQCVIERAPSLDTP